MRKLASIQKVSKIEPIEGADSIEKITTQGWNVVTKKGEFKEGDLMVYVEIDSILPEKPEFEFLRARKFRVRTIKLRGTYSQGICFPLSILPKDASKYSEGDDVTSILGIQKHDPEAEPTKVPTKEPKNRFVKWLCRYKIFRSIFLDPKTKGGFPTHLVSQSNETRIQNLSREFEANFKGTSGWSVKEKCEGQSATYILETKTKKILGIFPKTYKHFTVCSRSINLKTPHKCSWWDVAEKYSIKEKLDRVPYDVAIQGEICGPGIQKNYYGLDTYRLFIFTVKNLNTGELLNNKAIEEFCKEYDFEMVPSVDENYTIPETIPELVEFSKGKSKINTKLLREGLVFRKDGHSFKVINPEYLLKTEQD